MWFDARRALAEIEHSGQQQLPPQTAANHASSAKRRGTEAYRLAELAGIAAQSVRIPEVPQASATDQSFETDFEERAAVVEYQAGVPREWVEGYSRLQCLPPPPDISPKRWQQIIDDGGRFLDQWADQANRLGWTTLEVFGISLRAPEQRLDMRGLVPALGGHRIIMLTAVAATIEVQRNRQLRVFRKSEDGAVPIWHLSERNA